VSIELRTPLYILFLLLTACSSKPPSDLFSFEMAALNGRVDFSSLRSSKASVFIFLAPDCPLSQNYTRTLNLLRNEFAQDSIAFYGVAAGNLSQDADIDRFIKKYSIDFPVLLDRDYRLTNFFGATVTPEAFAVDLKGKIAYKGAIDNWASALGARRIAATEHYLRDALNSLRRNEEPRIKQIPPVGCFIERGLSLNAKS